MSFLGGPECSTAANPLAQFQKQTSADTSLQRDRLTSRSQPGLNGFRSPQQGVPEDAAFQEFQTAGPQQFEGMPMQHDPAAWQQMERLEAERMQRMGPGGGGGAGGGWAAEFGGGAGLAQQQMPSQGGAGATAFNPQDFAQFRQQNSPLRAQSGSPMSSYGGPQQSAFSRPPMYGSTFGGGMGGMGMQRPMFQSQMFNQQTPQQYDGKGKGRVQELSDTDWEKQFEELSTQDREVDDLDAEAQEAVERELNDVDR